MALTITVGHREMLELLGVDYMESGVELDVAWDNISQYWIFTITKEEPTQ